jgi:hypothetical protein
MEQARNAPASHPRADQLGGYRRRAIHGGKRRKQSKPDVRHTRNPRDRLVSFGWLSAPVPHERPGLPLGINSRNARSKVPASVTFGSEEHLIESRHVGAVRPRHSSGMKPHPRSGVGRLSTVSEEFPRSIGRRLRGWRGHGLPARKTIPAVERRPAAERQRGPDESRERVHSSRRHHARLRRTDANTPGVVRSSRPIVPRSNRVRSCLRTNGSLLSAIRASLRWPTRVGAYE